MRDARYDDWREAFAEDKHRGESSATRGRYYPTWFQGAGIWPKRAASAAGLVDQNGPEHATVRAHIGKVGA